MKKISTIILFTLYSGFIFAQEETNKQENIIDRTLEQNFKNKTGNDRANWSGLSSAFLNLFGTNGSTDLVISPTLFTLMHFGKIAKKETNYLDKDYRDQWFARNLQLNAGITPNSKNQLHIDAGTLGFKFAILNNMVATIKDYKSLDAELLQSDTIGYLIREHIVGLEKINTCESKTEAANIAYFQNNPSKALIAMLPKSLINKLKEKYTQSEIESLLLGENLSNSLTKRLSTKPTLTFSTNYKYDFVTSKPSTVAMSSGLTFYLGNIPFDIAANYTWSADSSKVNSKLVRRVAEASFGKNIKIAKWFELKPAFSYVNTQGPLYKKESEETFTASITPRLKINEQFWLPITIKYAEKNAQFFGFLSVQYSLK